MPPWTGRLTQHPWIALAATLLLGAWLMAACSDTRSGPTGASPPPGAEGASSLALSASQARPNILLITVDTLRADAVGAYGNPRARTPNMDALAQEGVRFSLAISPVPQTNPTHASIFTGAFPKRHGLVHHMGSTLSDSMQPLAELLAEAGYTTAGHYSWISFDAEYSGLERGFLTYQRHTVDRPWPGDRKPDWYEEYLDSKADVTTQGVLAGLEGGLPEPFFLWVHYNDAHFPFEPPSPFDTMFTQCQTCPDGSMETIKRIVEGQVFSQEEIGHLRGLYDGEVAFTDQQLGRLLEWLGGRGLLDRTVIVLTADHGESFGENGLWFHPEVLYNTALRVPLLIRYPGVVPGGVVEAPVSLTDLLPTLLGMLGMTPPKGVEGKSLLALMLGQESGEERTAFSQLWDGRKVAVVYQGWKLIKDRVTGALELYHLGQDPSESSNLAEAWPDMARSLEGRLDAWVGDQGFSP